MVKHLLGFFCGIHQHILKFYQQENGDLTSRALDLSGRSHTDPTRKTHDLIHVNASFRTSGVVSTTKMGREKQELGANQQKCSLNK